MVLHLTNTCKHLLHEDTLCYVETGQWFQRRFYDQSRLGIYALRHFIHPDSMDLQRYSFLIYLLISVVNMNEKLFCNETLELKERHKNS